MIRKIILIIFAVFICKNIVVSEEITGKIEDKQSIISESKSKPKPKPRKKPKKKAWFGVEIEFITELKETTAEGFFLKKEHFAKVKSVSTGSPAWKAGIKDGDILSKIEGEELKRKTSFSEIMAQQSPGDTILVEYIRGKEKFEVEVKLMAKGNPLIKGGKS